MTDNCIFLYKCNLIVVHESQIFLSISICFLFCPPVSLREQLRDCSEGAHTRKQEDERKNKYFLEKNWLLVSAGAFGQKMHFCIYLLTYIHSNWRVFSSVQTT